MTTGPVNQPLKPIATEKKPYGCLCGRAWEHKRHYYRHVTYLQKKPDGKQHGPMWHESVMEQENPPGGGGGQEPGGNHTGGENGAGPKLGPKLPPRIEGTIQDGMLICTIRLPLSMRIIYEGHVQKGFDGPFEEWVKTCMEVYLYDISKYKLVITREGEGVPA